MKLFRTGSIDVVQECRSYFGIELPSCLIKKRQDKLLSSVDNLFVDIVVSYDFCAAVQRINFFSLSITLYCLPLMLVNKN